MLVLRSLDGEPRKKYSRRNGVIDDQFFPGETFTVEKMLTRDTFTFKRAADLWRYAQTDNRAIARCLPKNGSSLFTLKKRTLRNDPLYFLLADVDSSLNGLLKDGLRDCVSAFIDKAGLSPSLGWVAKWSSSRFLISGERKASIHICFKLTEDITEDQAKHIMASIGADPRMSERGRLLATMSPTFDEGDLFSDFGRYAEIEYLDGDSLDPKPLLSKAAINLTNNPADDHIHRIIKGWETSNFFEAIKNYFANFKEDQSPSKKTSNPSKKTVPWRDIRALCKAASEMLSDGRLAHRHQIHYWLMRLNLKYERDFYTAISEITNDPNLLGEHSFDELFQQGAKIKRDFLQSSSCGSISDLFDDDETIEVDIESFQDMEEGDFDHLNIPRGTIVIKSAEGTGKTYFLIKRIIDRFDPETIASIGHRLNILQAQSEQWSLTYQYDIGIDADGATSLTEKQRKETYIPECDTPAITWHALDFIFKNGRSKRFQIIVIDEIEHVLDEFIVKDNQMGVVEIYDQMNRRFHRLIEICDAADLLIVGDATLSDGLTGYFLQLLKRWRSEEKRLLLNHADYVQRMDFYELNSREEAILTCIDLMNAGKTIAVCSDFGNEPDKPKVDDLAKILRHLSNRDENAIRAFDRREKENPRPNMYSDPHVLIKQAFDQGMVCSIFSPAYDCGWQIALDDEAYIFDAVVVICDHGLTHAEKLKEFFRRFRYTKQVFVYVKKRMGHVRPDQLERSHV